MFGCDEKMSTEKEMRKIMRREKEMRNIVDLMC